MEFRDCLQSAAENPVCHLAPTEGDQPRFRVLRMWFADGDGPHFCGLTPKSAWRQIRANPNVEICSFNLATDLQDVRSMRVTRKAEFLEELELKKKVLFIVEEADAERIRS